MSKNEKYLTKSKCKKHIFFAIGGLAGLFLFHLFQQGFADAPVDSIKNIFLAWFGLMGGILLANFIFRKK